MREARLSAHFLPVRLRASSPKKERPELLGSGLRVCFETPSNRAELLAPSVQRSDPERSVPNLKTNAIAFLDSFQ